MTTIACSGMFARRLGCTYGPGFVLATKHPHCGTAKSVFSSLNCGRSSVYHGLFASLYVV
jgi:hypothetical protein